MADASNTNQELSEAAPSGAVGQDVMSIAYFTASSGGRRTRRG